MSPAPILRITGAVKRYGGAAAVDGVDFDVLPDDIHALLGENGARKSTLTKSMAGVVHLDAGEIWLDGARVAPANPKDALHLGVAMVLQETSLVPAMTAAQNLHPGQESWFNRLAASISRRSSSCSR